VTGLRTSGRRNSTGGLRGMERGAPVQHLRKGGVKKVGWCHREKILPYCLGIG